nr:hypothetical protein [Tanacetum cinerariifolium]
MGGSSSQPRTDPPRSPINAFPIEELYTPEFSEYLQENTSYWQAPNTYEAAGEQVAISTTKNKKKATRNRQKKMIESDDAPRQTPWTTEEEIALAKGWLAVFENSKDDFKRSSEMARNSTSKIFNKVWGSKRHKSSGSGSFNTASGEASINLNTNVGDNDEDEVQEVQRPESRDKARAAGKKKGSKASGSSNVNEVALARLMVTEMITQEKAERLTFLEIKMMEAECGEREIKQQDMRFYLQSYDHLTGDQRNAMEEIKAKIKAKYNLQY